MKQLVPVFQNKVIACWNMIYHDSSDDGHWHDVEQFVASPCLSHLMLVDIQRRVQLLKMFDCIWANPSPESFAADLKEVMLPRLVYVQQCACAPASLTAII